MEKRLFSFVVALSVAVVADAGITDSLKSNVDSYIGKIISVSKDKIAEQALGAFTKMVPDDLIGICYEPINPGNWDELCRYFDNNIKVVPDNVCNSLPSIPGYRKKSNKMGEDVNEASSTPFKNLSDYCQRRAAAKEGEEEPDVTTAKSVISIIDEKGVDYSNKTNIQYKSGKTKQEYYGDGGMVSPENVLKKNGLAKNAFLKRDSESLSYLIHLSKSKGNIDNINDISYDDIVAPASVEEYNNDIREGASTLILDLQKNSPSALSSILLQKIKDKNETESLEESSKILSEASTELESGHARRIGVYETTLRGKNYITMPTQGMLDVMREDKKVKMAAKIYKQQVRETVFHSFMDRVLQSRKTLVSLALQKTVIMNQKFDANGTIKEINAVIGGSSSQKSDSNTTAEDDDTTDEDTASDEETSDA